MPEFLSKCHANDRTPTTDLIHPVLLAVLRDLECQHGTMMLSFSDYGAIGERWRLVSMDQEISLITDTLEELIRQIQKETDDADKF